MGLSERARGWLGVDGLERRLKQLDQVLQQSMQSTQAELAKQDDAVTRLETAVHEHGTLVKELGGSMRSFGQTQQKQTERINGFARLSRLVVKAINDASDPGLDATRQLMPAVQGSLAAEPDWHVRFEAAALYEAAMRAAYGNDPRTELFAGLLHDLAHQYIDEHADEWASMPFKIAIRESGACSKLMRDHLFRYLRSFRDHVVEQVVRDGLLQSGRTLDRALRLGIGLDERVLELPLALEFAALDTPGRVLDAGASLNIPAFKSLIPEPQGSMVHVTLAADTEPPLFDGDHYSYVFNDLRRLDLRDSAFDRAICLSTLEHVGMDNTRYGGTMETEPESWTGALSEIVRVVKPGGQVLVTVPYGDPVDHGWYHTFGPADLTRMAGQPQIAPVDSRFFFYDRGWYEGGPGDRVPQYHPEAVTGLAVLRFTRTR